MKKNYQVLEFSLKSLTLALFIIILGAGFLYAQRREGDSVTIKSWKIGKGQISEKHLTLNLDEHTEEFEIDIPDKLNTKLYRATMKKVFRRTVRKPSIQCWSVEFQELFKHSSGGYTLGGNLLSTESPTGGDNIPGSENVFCPIEMPVKPFDGGYLPIKEMRIFWVEGFMIKLQVEDYSYDEEAVRLRKLQIAMDITNLTKKV